MKRFLLSLPVLLVTTSPAFAGGHAYDNGGCNAEQTGLFCSTIGFLLAALIVSVVIIGIWDAYKMKTDPTYRARAEQWRRECEEKRRRGY